MQFFDAPTPDEILNCLAMALRDCMAGCQDAAVSSEAGRLWNMYGGDSGLGMLRSRAGALALASRMSCCLADLAACAMTRAQRELASISCHAFAEACPTLVGETVAA
jgi:hypothetical protein